MRTEAIRMTRAEGQNKEEYDIVMDHRDLVLDEHEILVKSGQPVEFGQPLFIVE